MSSAANFGRSVAASSAARESDDSDYGRSVALPAWLTSSDVFAVAVVNHATDIVFANAKFAQCLGFDSADALTGRNLQQSCLPDGESWDDWKLPARNAYRLKQSSGDIVSFTGEVGETQDRNSEPLSFCVLCPQDDAEMQQFYEHAAHMEAVAGLSSGIAHDFNNLLTVLVGNLYLLGEELRGDEATFSRIKAARDTALRGSELTKQLLSYARTDESDDADVKPASVVNRLQPLLEKLVGSRIRMEVDVTADTQTISVSRTQLESAVVNLVINARDAIDGAGTIRIGVHEDERADDGEWRVVVSVADDGPGMSPEIKERVFEPFFTTKDDGKGTGLGLSMVRWFADNSGGRVEIDSEPGSGAIVSILLPQAHHESGDTTCSRTIPLSVLPSGEERIALLIDDVEVRAMTQQTLAVLGYDVQRASIEELSRDSADSARFDLVVVDAANSADLHAQVVDLRNRFGVPVLALTARKVSELDQKIQLRKPFSLVELASGVRGVLDGEPVSG